jgi:uncharacterized cupin superfamily protein
MFIVLEGIGTYGLPGSGCRSKRGRYFSFRRARNTHIRSSTTSDAPLKYLSVSTREQPELVEYPDSGKFQAMAVDQNGETVRYLQRPSASLDYWQDEP